MKVQILEFITHEIDTDDFVEGFKIAEVINDPDVFLNSQTKIRTEFDLSVQITPIEDGERIEINHSIACLHKQLGHLPPTQTVWFIPASDGKLYLNIDDAIDDAVDALKAVTDA